MPPPPRVADEPFKEVKDCIKQLGLHKWLFGPSLIYERDDDKSSSAFRIRFVEPDGSSSKVQESLEGPPSDPNRLIQLVRCFATHATWRIGQWAYFKSKPWTPGQGTEAAAIEFVQKNAPSMPMLTVLEHYIEPLANRSCTLLLNIPGKDLDKVWKNLPYE